MGFKRRAKEKVIMLKNNLDNLFIIHYSCESFYDREDAYSPRISSIAILNFHTGQTYSFSIHKVAEINRISKDNIESSYDDLEKVMLNEYFDFISHHSSSYYLHWNMRSINYGFGAIKQRYRVLGGTPVDITETRLIDLSSILVDYYGSEYIGHRRMEQLIDYNKITKMDFLKGPEEAQAFADKEYIRLHKSTLRKVDAFSDILISFLSGTLKTRTNKLVQAINEAYNHWVFRFIVMALSAWGILSLIFLFLSKIKK